MYPSLEKAIECFRGGVPLSVVRFKSGHDHDCKYGMILKGYREVVPLEVGCLREVRTGACYFDWTIAAEAVEAPYDWSKNGWEEQQLELLSVIENNGVLLPKKILYDDNKDFFYVTELLQLRKGWEWGFCTDCSAYPKGSATHR